MKNLTFYPFIAAILLLACNDRNKTSANAQPATAAEITEARSELDKKVEELQQLTPYTIEEMRAFLPEELDGDSAINKEAYSNMGTGFARAAYPLSDSTSLELSIFDCGGIAGAGFYSRQFIDHLGSQSENDNEYTRVIDFKGEKAIEHFNKRRNFSSLTYTAADRLLIILEGKGLEGDELKDKAGELRFKQ